MTGQASIDDETNLLHDDGLPSRILEQAGIACMCFVVGGNA